jgi:phosphatidylinositol alpha-mannosyltransferase
VGYNLLVPFNRAFVDVTVGWKLRQHLRGLIRAHDFDILHTHCPTAPTLPVMAIQTASCAQVGTFHTTAGRGWLQDTFQPYLMRTVVAKLDARIAVSRTAEASAMMYYPGEYYVIPNGVDVDRFHPGVAGFEEWRDPDRVNLLFVGRLDPRKGIPYLLQAMTPIVELTGGRVRLLVVGDSYLRAKFEASVPGAAREHVHFLGHVSSTDLPRWYATGDIFISPALGNESFGIVLLEAMAAGRAVVASDIPGYRSVIRPGINGDIFPPKDVAALARTVAALVENPERRHRLGEAGRATALEFAWPRVTAQIEQVYRRVVTRRNALYTAA